jgi:SAM-dependent MidA family methyltransferase
MAHALYDPSDGYYGAGARRLGTQGDFITASDCGSGFGKAIAQQLIEFDGQFDGGEFQLLEVGCGRGLLARDILDAATELAPDFHKRLAYQLIDQSREMLTSAGANVPEARTSLPAEVEPGARGAVLAVELLDALPVRRLRRRDGQLQEICVGLDEAEQFIELERPCPSDLAALAENFDALPEEGCETEVAPGLEQQLRQIDRWLATGLVVLVDYGDLAGRLYGRNPRGTLLAYRNHVAHEELLQSLGEQDLTASVNFTAVEKIAVALGWKKLVFTTQDRFLVANGLLQVFEARDMSEATDVEAIKARLQAMTLIHPHAMGRRFKVMVLAKGVEPELNGLEDPFH